MIDALVASSGSLGASLEDGKAGRGGCCARRRLWRCLISVQDIWYGPVLSLLRLSYSADDLVETQHGRPQPVTVKNPGYYNKGNWETFFDGRGSTKTSSAVVCRSPLQALTQGLGEAEVRVCGLKSPATLIQHTWRRVDCDSAGIFHVIESSIN